tara:strand:- start:98 stop:592 length:495 start_codon:yes stop_codon:yes gene_type:complete
MRHAKSDWNSYQEDFDRPISRRGVADLGLISSYFAKLQRPDCILCSPALRTKQTLEILRETLGKPLSLIKIDFIDSLYLASSEEIENQIASYLKVCESVMIVSHNPGLENLLYKIIEDKRQVNLYRKIFPTSSVYEIELEISEIERKLTGAKITNMIRPGPLRS